MGLNFSASMSQKIHLLAEMQRRLSQSEAERRRLERELLEICERERRTIGHDLHDGVGQHLTALSLMAHALCESLAASPLLGPARELNQHIRETITETRRLARGLAPVVIECGGLSKALAELAELTQRGGRARCTFSCSKNVGPVATSVAVHLYRIAQEAVNNAVKHAGALAPTGAPVPTSALEIRLRLERGADGLKLEITDNGQGLPVDRSAPGMGLRVMDFRARLIGGKVSVSSARGQGVRIVCLCPEHDSLPPSTVPRSPADSKSSGPSRRPAPVETTVPIS